MINVNLTMKDILNLPESISDEQYINAVIDTLGFENLKELFPCDKEQLIDSYNEDPECTFIRNWPCSIIALKAMCAKVGAYKGIGNGMEGDVIKACIRRAVKEVSKETDTLNKEHVLHALRDVYFANAGDNDTENLIEALAADILSTSQVNARVILAGH